MTSGRTSLLFLICVLASPAALSMQVKPLRSLLRTGRIAPKAVAPAATSSSFTADADAFTLELEKDLLTTFGLTKTSLKMKVDPEKVASADQAKLKEAFTTQCTSKLEDLFDKYYARAQYQGPEGEEQMGHTMATHFAFNCNKTYPIEPVTCNTLSTSLMNLVNDHKPIVIPNVTINGTQITEGACFESMWPNNTGLNASVVEGKRLVVYDVNVSRCFGDVFVHYASPDPSIGTPFLPMSARSGSPVHTYMAVVAPLEEVNQYSTRVGQCAKPPVGATWNMSFSVAAVHRPNGTCPEAAAPASLIQIHQDPPPPPSLEKADAAAPVYNNGEEWCGAFFDEYAKALAAEKK